MEERETGYNLVSLSSKVQNVERGREGVLHVKGEIKMISERGRIKAVA